MAKMRCLYQCLYKNVPKYVLISFLLREKNVQYMVSYNVTLGLRSIQERINNFIYTHTSKKIHSAKKKLILIVLKIQIVLHLILSYKSRKQCILIGKSPSSTNRLSTQVLLSLYRSIVLLLFLLLLILLYLLADDAILLTKLVPDFICK